MKRHPIGSDQITSYDIQVIHCLGEHAEATEWVGSVSLPNPTEDEHWPGKILVGDREYVPAPDAADFKHANKKCSNCKYRKIELDSYPCKTCTNMTHWWPVREDAEPDSQRCDNCEFAEVSTLTHPCDKCKITTFQRNYWKPAG